MINRRTLLAAAAGTLPLAACDEATMKTIRERMNPTAVSGAGPVAGMGGSGPTAAQVAGQGAISATVRTPARAWTFDVFREAMAASGRNPTINASQFADIQSRKPAAMARIKAYLEGKFGSADPAVLAAFESVPRDYFHYAYAAGASTAWQAYEDSPKPWAIGHGSVLSDYLGQAYMSQLAAPKPGDVTLEIGTGSDRKSVV